MGQYLQNANQSERDAFEQNVRALAGGVDPATNITSTAATALTVAATGTNYGLQVDESTASAVTGVKVTPAAAGAGVAVSVIGGNSAENLTIDAEGAGRITLGGVSTGGVGVTQGGIVVGAGGATITGQAKIVGPTTTSGLLVTASANVAGATLAPLQLVASTASQALISIQGVFISTASINLAANKTAFIIPVYHATQGIWGYIATSVGVS